MTVYDKHKAVGAKREVLGHGSIELLDYMGSDLAVINNAKVSFDREMSLEEYTQSQDGYKHGNGLIDFMMRERHGSPFERPEFVFRVKAPIFVMREWHRHRHAELNEESMRYSLKDTFEGYLPETENVRSQVGKPGAYRFEPIEDRHVVNEALSKIELSYRFSFRTYKELVEMGVAKELARVVIPVGMFSTMIWKANLRSILNFLSLRNSDNAQWEIQQYAIAMEEMVSMVVPVTMGAFNRHGRRTP